MSKADSLRKIVERNALDLSEAIDDAQAEAIAAYEQIAPRATQPGAGAELAARLHAAVAGVRTWAHAAGLSGVLDELRAIAPGAAVNLGGGGQPQRSEVDAYVRDAAAEAVQRADAEKDKGDPARAFVSAAYRADVLIDDQAVREYERARTAAYEDLERLDDNPARGFVVARDASQLRSIRADSGPVVVVAKRRSEINDARTCDLCRAEDGQLRLLGQEFAYPIPAHPRCRGVSHLWGVGWVWEESGKAMKEISTRRIVTIDVRADSVDDEKRTISGVVVSDETLDAHDSIIRASGWDLNRYEKNPILLWAHKGSQPWEPPKPEDVLGTTRTRVDAGRLVSDFVFSAKGVNPQADMVFEQMKAKIIRAASVGFRAREYHFEERDGGEILIVDRATLVEVSVVPVGSNENALSREFKAACCGSTAALPQETDQMSDNKETKVAALPPEIASITGAATIEGAVRAFTDHKSQLAELELKLDKATKDAAAFEERAIKAEKDIADRFERDTTSEVDALIKAGRISADKRDAALALAKSSLDAFRSLYPAEQVAPRAPMLAQVVKSDTEARVELPQPQLENPIAKRASELVKEGVEYTNAWARAIKEHTDKPEA